MSLLLRRHTQRVSMPRAIRLAAAAQLCAAIVCFRLAAQDASDSATYIALTRTPLGALTSQFDVSITGRQTPGVTIFGRYGIQSLDTHEYINNFGVGFDLPVGGARFGATVGYWGPACYKHETCPGHFMGSVAFAQNIVLVGLGQDPNGAAFNVGVDVHAGFAFPKDSTLVSGIASVPISLIHRGSGYQLIPYLAPGLGVGAVRSDDGTEAGLLFAFNGGLALAKLGVFSVDASVSRMFLRDGNWVAGIGLAIATRH
jgi:hypothetical protein